MGEMPRSVYGGFFDPHVNNWEVLQQLDSGNEMWVFSGFSWLMVHDLQC
jgi:hypothetical protein